MSSLPQLYPRLSLHLTDRAHTPFISSPLSRRPASTPASSNTRAEASRQSQLQALHSLTTTALASHDAAARLGLGLPSRIMVEHGAGGPVVLTSYVRARRKNDVSGSGGGASECMPMPVPVPGMGMGGSGSTYSIEAGTGVRTAVQASAEALGMRATATTTSPEPRNPNPNPRVQSLGATEVAPLSPLPPLASIDQPSTPSSANPQIHPSLNPSPNLVPNPSHSSTNGKPASASSFTFPTSRALAAGPLPFSQQPTAAFSPPSSPFPEENQDEDEDTPRAPTLLSLVISPSPEDLPDARRAAARLERIGRELQAALAVEEGDNDHMVAPAPPGTEVGGDSAPGSVPGTLGATPGEVTGDEED